MNRVIECILLASHRGIGRAAVSLCTLLILVLICLSGAVSYTGSEEITYYYKIDGSRFDFRFEEPSALAIDGKYDLTYIADSKAKTVYAFSVQGTPKFQIGSKEGLNTPIGIAVDKNGKLFISESEGGPIKIVDTKGKISLLEIPSAENEEAPKPGRMVFDRDGNLYVVERANGRIFIFDKNLKFKLKFGSVGNDRGQFKMLEDVAVDLQGRIFALDSVEVSVQVFDREGNYLYRFGSKTIPEELSFPKAISIDIDNRVWLVDSNQHVILKYDILGNYLGKFGQYGQSDGYFFYPIDLETDVFGRLYILESGAKRLQVFKYRQGFNGFGSP